MDQLRSLIASNSNDADAYGAHDDRQTDADTFDDDMIAATLLQ